ncbi:MAG: hypothetical protein WCT01_01435 [Candidatus Shapirobacteria bacterium]
MTEVPKRLSIITPACNEFAALKNNFPEEILDSVPRGYDPSLLIMIGHSNPDFISKVAHLSQTNPRVSFIDLGFFTKPLGHVYTQGYTEALQKPNPDVLLEMDLNGSHPTKYIADFLNAHNQGKLAAFSTRFSENGSAKGYPLARRINSYLGTVSTNLLFGWTGSSYIPDMTSGFQLWDSQIISDIMARHPSGTWLSDTIGPGHFVQTEGRVYTREIVPRSQIAMIPIVWGEHRFTPPNKLPLTTSLKAFKTLLTFRKNLRDQKFA